jgi:caffeoyl-CoA O-methyltransferase
MAKPRGMWRWGAALGVVLLTAFGIQAYCRVAADEETEASYRGLRPSAALDVIREMQHGQGVTAVVGRHMYELIVARGYTRGLDIGTAHAYSALWFGLAVQPKAGSVVTIEIDPATAEVARANIRRAGLEAVIDSRVNDAFAEIPLLDGDFDFVFIDTGTPDNQRFLELLSRRIRPGGAILAHNATFMRWQQPEYWRAIHERPEFETSVFKRLAITLKRGGGQPSPSPR